MIQKANRTLGSILCAGLLGLLSCGAPADAPWRSPAGKAEAPGEDPGGRDTGWVAGNSFEVGATIAATLVAPATHAEDESEQLRLIDQQIRYAKNAMAASGYTLNQLVDEVSFDVQPFAPTTDGAGSDGEANAAALVRIDYQARVDLIRAMQPGDPLPTLANLGQLSFSVPLPLYPVAVFSHAGSGCAVADTGDHTVTELNLYYYFDHQLARVDDDGNKLCPLAVDHQDPQLGLVIAPLTIDEVYPVRPTYPEYDQLLGVLGDDIFGPYGFRAAILPAPDGNRFEKHRTMFESSYQLGLQGERYCPGLDILGNPDPSTPLLCSADQDDDEVLYVRYVYGRDETRIVIDLYNPTGNFTELFRARLGGDYNLVWYNGHSGYGTRNYLLDPDAYAPIYQIVGMHSCRSYAYYARQVLRAKASETDPKGFAAADIIATGNPSYPTGSPTSLRILLQRLLDGIHAVHQGRGDDAPSWQDIIAEINQTISLGTILYGAAGVRDNCWAPGTPHC